MVEFKAVVNDMKTGKSYNVPVTGHHANSLIGKKIGDTIDGIFVGLPGYKLSITGGSDKDGFCMRKDLPGPRRKQLLLTVSTGMYTTESGLRKRKAIRGNTVATDTVQINMKIVAQGPKPVEELIVKKEEKK